MIWVLVLLIVLAVQYFGVCLYLNYHERRTRAFADHPAWPFAPQAATLAEARAVAADRAYAQRAAEDAEARDAERAA